jgi:hypothetical protein
MPRLGALIHHVKEFLMVDPSQIQTSSSAAFEAAIDPRDQKIAELETRVAELQEQLAARAEAEATPAAPPAPPEPFDVQARVAELVAQGVSEADAAQQAAYEQKLREDAQAG